MSAVAWSPDGTRIASASGDRTVRIWDAATGGQAGQLDGHTDSVTAVAWSPDGTRLASASGDETVRIWDAAGNCYTVHLDGSPTSIALHHHRMAVAYRTEIFVFEVRIRNQLSPTEYAARDRHHHTW